VLDQMPTGKFDPISSGTNRMFKTLSIRKFSIKLKISSYIEPAPLKHNRVTNQFNIFWIFLHRNSKKQNQKFARTYFLLPWLQKTWGMWIDRWAYVLINTIKFQTKKR